MYPPGYYVPQPAQRPIGVAILAVLVVLGGVLLLLAAIAVLLLSAVVALGGLTVFGLAGGILGGVLLVFALIWIGVGLGLWHLRSWAWWLAVIVMLLSIIGSFATPIFAVIPGIILVYLLLVHSHFH